MATEEVIIKTDKAVKNVDSLEDAIRDLTETMSKTNKEQKEHEKTLLDNAANAKIMGVSINSLTAGLKNTITSLKASIKSLGAFKVALAATGIGLVVLALASFRAALKTSKRLADEFSDAGAFLSAITDQMTSSFGKFFDKITENEDGSNRFISFLTNTIRGLAAAVPGLNAYVDGLIAVGNAGAKANKEQREFQEGLAVQNLEVSKVALSIEQLVNQTRRLGVTGQEQFDLVTEALELFNDKIRLSTEVLDAEESSLQAVVDASVSGSQERIDAEIAFTEFLTKRINTERQLSAQQRELLNRQTEAERKAFAERKKNFVDEDIRRQEAIVAEAEATAKIAENILALAELESAAFEASVQRKLDAEIAFNIEQAKLADLRAAAELAREEVLQAQRVAAANQAGDIITDLTNFQLGSTFTLIKAHLAEALAKAFAQLGPIGGAIASGGILALFSILANRITSLAAPEPPRFAGGGLIDGPSHAQGGVKYALGGRVVELEGGEAVINKRATSMFRPQLSMMNQAGGGVAFQTGGVIPAGIDVNPRITANDLRGQVIPVLYKDDLDKVNDRVKVTESRATL